MTSRSPSAAERSGLLRLLKLLQVPEMLERWER